MPHHDTPAPAGIWPVLYAYFDAHDRLDRAALHAQIDATLAAGAPGIVILGLATEVHRLSETEKRQFIDWTAQHLAGRVPLAVTISGDSVDAQVALAEHALARGAAWLILQPPSLRDRPESFYYDFFGAVLARTGAPTGIQNAPEYLGVGLSPDAIARLAGAHPNFRLLKGEGPAISIRQTIQALRAAGSTLPVFNGRGGQELVDNLRAGCAGFIVAPDAFDHQVAIYRTFVAGDEGAAETMYADILPGDRLRDAVARCADLLRQAHRRLAHGFRGAARPWRDTDRLRAGLCPSLCGATGANSVAMNPIKESPSSSASLLGDPMNISFLPLRRAVFRQRLLRTVGAVVGLTAALMAIPVQALENGLARTPPMGWSSWNAFFCNYNADTLMAQAHKLVDTGLQAKGYRYFRIQECIFKPTRDADGNLVVRPERFPHGLKPVVDDLHKLGFKVGIYTDSGTYTCQGKVKGSAGSYGYEQQDANYFAALGADYVEADWCNIPWQNFPGQSHEQVARTLVTRMRDAIAHTGRPMLFFTFAGWDLDTHAWKWGRSLANVFRTDEDITMKPGHLDWKTIVRNFTTHASHPQQSGPGGFGDPDMLGVGLPGISDVEGRSMFSLWAMEAAPLSIGTDLTDTAQFTAATATTYGNTEVIAIDQDALGLQALPVSDDSYGRQVWRKSLANQDVAVAFFNSGSSVATLSTNARAAGLPASGHYRVRDLWSHRDSTSQGALSARVQPHEVVLLRVAAGAAQPKSEVSNSDVPNSDVR